ncbi:hypothetical protein [Puerhibacterium puerhi]|uniref:hypothetical protein n=1 Tax=Puerhibacterium puerhi TaxID=2692623 RepID=UPI00135903E5|nr:hypothetical protein [Puerhibacterium puerhi]
MRVLTPRTVAVTAAVLMLAGITTPAVAAEPSAAEPGVAVVDDDLPDPTDVVENGDGTTTLVYDDGATFTSQTAVPAGDGARTLALAAASFPWSATYDVSITSRSWTTSGSGDVWVDVSSITNCGGKAQSLSLYRLSGSSWSRVGTVRSVSCSGGSYVWRGVAQGTYRFQLWDSNTTDAYRNHSASGTVRYP